MLRQNFNVNYKKGQKFEAAVTNTLHKLLPDYTVRPVNGEDPIDKYLYGDTDIIIKKDDHTALLIECKWQEDKYNISGINGWDGDYNQPLNLSNVNEYKTSQYPLYLITVHTWCHKIFVADLETLNNSQYISSYKKNWGKNDTLLNYDCRSWDEYTSLDDAVQDIIRKEKLC